MRIDHGRKLVGYYGGIPVYEDPSIPPDTIYLINPSTTRYEPLPPLVWPKSERPPWSWSLPGEKR